MSGKQKVVQRSSSAVVKVAPASSSAVIKVSPASTSAMIKVSPASTSAVIKVSPSSSSAVIKVVPARKARSRTDAFESQKTTKTLCKDARGERYSELSKSEKSGTFVDKRSGNHGFKQEVKYKSSAMVKDKVHGCTTEYETQVKVKKVTTYNTPKKAATPTRTNSSAGYKSIYYYDY